jgi:hypothetical protein
MATKMLPKTYLQSQFWVTSIDFSSPVHPGATFPVKQSPSKRGAYVNIRQDPISFSSGG